MKCGRMQRSYTASCKPEDQAHGFVSSQHAELTANRASVLRIYRADLEESMPSTKQRSAARRNIKKAAQAARKKRTIAHLPKKTRTALGEQAAKVAKRKRRAAR